MLVDIYAHILQPKDEGDYIVIVSAFSCEQSFTPDRRLQRIEAADSLEEANMVRQRLMRELRADVEGGGYLVRAVKVRD